MRTMRRRIHISRLELDLRGVTPEAARAVADALGPAIARAWSGAGADSATRPAGADRQAGSAPALTDGLATRIVRTIHRRLE